MKRTVLSLFASAMILALGWFAWSTLHPAREEGPPPPPPPAHGDPLTPADGSLLAQPPLPLTTANGELPETQLQLPERVPDPLAQTADGFGDLIVHVRRDTLAVAKVTVLAAQELVGDPWAEEFEAVSDDHGSAHFHLPAGHWVCRTTAGGRAAVDVEASRRVTVELLVPPSHHVDGICTDPEGRPIAGADVLVADSGSAARFHAIARTAPDGTFALEQLGRTQRLAAVHERYAPSLPQVVTGAPGERSHVTFVLHQKYGKLQGSIHDRDGKPLAGARLLLGAAGAENTLPPFAAAPPQHLVTDANGNFASRALPPGDLQLRVVCPGFGPMQRELRIAAGQVTQVQIVLLPGARVRGVVLGIDGKPADGAAVWCGPLRAFGTRWTRTATDGSYLLDDLPIGKAEANAYLPLDARARDVVTLVADTDQVWNPELRATATALVQGVIIDHEEQPLGGWRIVALDRSGGGAANARNGNAVDAALIGAGRNAATTASPDGIFVLRPLQPGGRVQVLAFRPDRDDRGFPDAQMDLVAVGGPPITLRVGDARRERGSIHGSVTGPDGRGLATTIGVLHLERQHYASYATDANGAFDIDGLPAGTLQVEVVHDRHPLLKVPPFELRGGARIDLGRLELIEGHSVYGTLLGPDGTAPATAVVRVLTRNGREAASVSYGGGSFRSTPLAPGDYVLQLQADELAAASLPITIGAADLLRDVRLLAGFPCRVAVTAPIDLAVGSWTSLILIDDRHQPIWNMGLPLHDRAVEYQLWLAPGRYQATVVDELQNAASGALECRADAPNAPLYLQLHAR